MSKIISPFVGELIQSDARRALPRRQGRSKPVKVLIKPMSFDAMPDCLRYQEWLRDKAFMAAVLEG